MCDLALMQTFKMSGVYDIIKDRYYIKRTVINIEIAYISVNKHCPCKYEWRYCPWNFSHICCGGLC